MNDFDFRRMDLNLLKAFHALDVHRSVTRAAASLGLGQPAMSHALARLREITRDELFTRSAGGLTPTLRAKELAGPVRYALSQIEVAFFGPTSFDPATEKATIRIGMTDFVAGVVLPPLTQRLTKLAPRVAITVVNCTHSNAASLLDERRIDIAIGYFPSPPDSLASEPLFEESHCCVFNAKLVDARAPITLEQYLAAPHLLVTGAADQRGFVDDILAKLGKERFVLISSPFFLLTGYLLQQLPLIATLPRHYAECCCAASELTISPPPFETPTFTIAMTHHRRDGRSPILSFLRDLVKDSLSPQAPAQK